MAKPKAPAPAPVVEEVESKTPKTDAIFDRMFSNEFGDHLHQNVTRAELKAILGELENGGPVDDEDEDESATATE